MINFVVSSLKSSSSMENPEFDTIPFRPLLNVMAALKVTGGTSKSEKLHGLFLLFYSFSLRTLA